MHVNHQTRIEIYKVKNNKDTEYTTKLLRSNKLALCKHK